MTPRRRRAVPVWAHLRRATSATAVANLVILAGGALGGILSARALGPAGQGQLAVATLWPALIHTVGSLGLQSSCSYHLARWPHRRPAILSWLRHVIALQVTVMTAVSSVVLRLLSLAGRIDPILAVEYSTWAASATIVLYGACCAQGTRDFARFNAIRLVTGATPAMLMLAGTTALQLTPAEAGAAYVVPTWCTALLVGKWLHQASRGPRAVPLSPRERRSIWSYGWRSAGSLSGLSLNATADSLVLGLMVAPSSVGIYSAAAAASSPLQSLVSSVGMTGLPAVAALTGKAKMAATRRALRQSAALLVVIAPVLAVALPWAVPWVYGARYSRAVGPAEILLLGAVFSALASVADDMLRAHGHPGFVGITQGAGAIITCIGALMFASHSLSAVSAASSLGFACAFALALARLRAVNRRVPVHRARSPRSKPAVASRPDPGTGRLVR